MIELKGLFEKAKNEAIDVVFSENKMYGLEVSVKSEK